MYIHAHCNTTQTLRGILRTAFTCSCVVNSGVHVETQTYPGVCVCVRTLFASHFALFVGLCVCTQHGLQVYLVYHEICGWL